MSCKNGHPTCADASDDTHAGPVAIETEPRCAVCRYTRVRREGAICRHCDADMTAMHRGRQW